MTSVVDLVVEIVKAQAGQRRMSAREIEETIRRTAAALRAIGQEGAPAAAPTTGQAPAEAESTVGVDEAARRLGVSRLTVYKYIRQGRVSATRKGRSYAVRLDDVLQLRSTRRRRARPARGGRRAGRPGAARRGRRSR